LVSCAAVRRSLPAFPTRRSSDLGDAAGIFNVSSASAFVAASAGCHVAKHGGRSVSSKSGSADLLEAAGIQINLTAEQIARSITRSEEHTSELQSRFDLVCRLLLD